MKAYGGVEVWLHVLTSALVGDQWTRDWGKPRKISVTTAGVPAEIRIENLGNMSVTWSVIQVL
jgi:hypothetical protein